MHWVFIAFAVGRVGGSERIVQVGGTLGVADPSGKETHWTDFSVLVSGAEYQISNRYFNGEVLMSGSDGYKYIFCEQNGQWL